MNSRCVATDTTESHESKPRPFARVHPFALNSGLNADGDWFATTSNDPRELLVWDLAAENNSSLTPASIKFEARIEKYRFELKSARLHVATADGKVHRCELEAPPKTKLVATFDAGSPVTFSPFGSWVIVDSPTGLKTVQPIADSLPCKDAIPLRDTIGSLTVEKWIGWDQYLVLRSASYQLVVWDMSTPNPQEHQAVLEKEWHEDDDIEEMAQGRFLYAYLTSRQARGSRDRIRVWNLLSWPPHKNVLNMPPGILPRIDASPDGQWVIVLGSETLCYQALADGSLSPGLRVAGQPYIARRFMHLSDKGFVLADEQGILRYFSYPRSPAEGVSHLARSTPSFIAQLTLPQGTHPRNASARTLQDGSILTQDARGSLRLWREGQWSSDPSVLEVPGDQFRCIASENQKVDRHRSPGHVPVCLSR